MKTKLIIVLFLLFSFVKLGTIKPSEDIWEKVKSFWEQGLMYNENVFYFVFDEYNYTKFDLSSKEMLELQKKQEYLYKTYNIRNYIFAVKTLDTSMESIDKAADSLSTYIQNDFKVEMSNSIIALIVMDLQKVRIRIGSSLNNKITDSEAQKIISNMGTNMRAKNYYKAFYNIITDIRYYYLNEESSSSSKSKNTKTETNSSDNSLLKCIVGLIVIIGIIILISYGQKEGHCKRSELSSSDYHNYGGDDGHIIGGGGYSGGVGGGGSSGGGRGGGSGGNSGGATGGW